MSAPIDAGKNGREPGTRFVPRRVVPLSYVSRLSFLIRGCVPELLDETRDASVACLQSRGLSSCKRLWPVLYALSWHSLVGELCTAAVWGGAGAAPSSYRPWRNATPCATPVNSGLRLRAECNAGGAG